MVLVVTHETFNEAVRENMELLDLTEEEATEETINQFKAQGVDLSNIMMKSSLSIVKSSLKNLEKHLANVKTNESNICNELTILNIELNKDLVVRVHAAKEGAYPLLIDCLRKISQPVVVLETLTSLMNGYPDLLTREGINFMLEFLNEKSDEHIILQTLKWIKVCVSQHEKNRASIITMNIAEKFRILLQTFCTNKKIVMEICMGIRQFVLDDDVRVVVGNSHEHARSFASELLCLNTEFLHSYTNDPEVLYELLQTLNVLIVRNEFCTQVHDQDGVKYILDAMVTYPDNDKISRICLQLLKGLAGSDEVKEPIIRAGAAPIIVSAMNRHKNKPNVISSACVCISALALRSPNNGAALAEAGAPDIIVQCMSMYKDNPVIQKHSCAAIRNHISRCPDQKEEYLQLGVEDLLNELNISEGRLEFEAKSVLKELGCSVHLEEEWKGLGRQLPNDFTST